MPCRQAPRQASRMGAFPGLVGIAHSTEVRAATRFAEILEKWPLPYRNWAARVVKVACVQLSNAEGTGGRRQESGAVRKTE
jgi:hypothetical protein